MTSREAQLAIYSRHWNWHDGPSHIHEVRQPCHLQAELICRAGLG